MDEGVGSGWRVDEGVAPWCATCPAHAERLLMSKAITRRALPPRGRSRLRGSLRKRFSRCFIHSSGASSHAEFTETGETHAMRNELVEELIIDPEAKVMQNRTEKSIRASQTSGTESKQGRREEEVRLGQEKRPRCLHSEKPACPRRGSLSAEKREVKLSRDRVRWQRLPGCRTT